MSQGRDRLTGLPDRSGAYTLAGNRVTEAAARGAALAALWIDIDRFHLINESFGHPGGDLLVQTLAKRLEMAAAGRAELARVSGDEFVMLLPGVALEAATIMAKKIESSLAEPIEIETVPIHPTASIGIAILESGEDAAKLLLRADKAKTMAKARGGHCYCVSGDRLIYSGYRLAREELEIEAKLHMAIDSGGLQLHYQPIVRRDGSIEAIEALMRCRVGDEQIPPVKLIPVAEKTGLITRLGEWTMSEGALFARLLLDSGYPVKVAINVSRAQLLDTGFVSALHGAILCANVPSQLLELELTESLFLDASPTVQFNLHGACESGVSLAIDDFGTGYSSLASLKDIPAKKLKLDRSFVTVLPNDGKALAVVRAMARLGLDLGMIVVAEGVETQAQYRCLDEIGVHAIQGYLLTPPLPRGNVLNWLKEKCRQPEVATLI